MTDSRESHAVHPIVLAAILLVAIAVLLVALRSWLHRPAVEEVVAAAPVAEESALLPPMPEPAAAVAVGTSVGPATIPAASVGRVESIRVVLLPGRAETPDPAALAMVDTVRQATIRALRTVAGVEVVDVTAAELSVVVPSNAGPLFEGDLAYFSLSTHYDAGVVAEIHEQTYEDTEFWTIRLQGRRPNGGSTESGKIPRSGGFSGVPDPFSGVYGPEALGARFAERIVRSDALMTSAPGGASEARAVLLDTARPDVERMQALARLQIDSLDAETIAAAVRIAALSTSSEIRARMWRLLRQRTFDASLAQPMSYALLTDPEAAVRSEAALGLAAYLGYGDSLASLHHAASVDSSAEVRLAARMASMTYDEQQAFKRETLLDRRLTPADRLAPTIVTTGPGFRRREPRAYDSAVAEEALAYAEIVAATEDPEIQVRGLYELSAILRDAESQGRRAQAIEPEITRVLIESAESGYLQVRRYALGMLVLQGESPEIRAAVERALQADPALAAELDIADYVKRIAAEPVPAR